MANNSNKQIANMFIRKFEKQVQEAVDVLQETVQFKLSAAFESAIDAFYNDPAFNNAPPNEPRSYQRNYNLYLASPLEGFKDSKSTFQKSLTDTVTLPLIRTEKDNRVKHLDARAAFLQINSNFIPTTAYKQNSKYSIFLMQFNKKTNSMTKMRYTKSKNPVIKHNVDPNWVFIRAYTKGIHGTTSKENHKNKYIHKNNIPRVMHPTPEWLMNIAFKDLSNPWYLDKLTKQVFQAYGL